LHHPTKGAATVANLLFPEAAGDVAIEIRFNEDEQIKYSQDEYHQVGFGRALPKGEDVDDEGRRTPVSDQSVQHRSEMLRPRQTPLTRSEVATGEPLPEYTTWTPTEVPDPRVADGVVLARHMKSVVEVEGPVTADRIYKLVLKAAGFVKVTRPVRHQLNRALFAMRGIDIREHRNPHTHWPQRVARLDGTPEAAVRELGDRDLYEVPLDEIATLMEDLTGGQRPRSTEDIKRRILDAYAGKKLTNKASQYLDAALDLLGA
jgi:hypothetical protein